MAETPPDLVEVDTIEGFKIKLPKDEAEKAIKRRDELKSESRKVHEELGRIKAERDNAEAARVKAETDAKAAEAMKKGEVEKATELLTKSYRDRESKIVANLRDKAIRAAITATPKVAPSAIDDIADQLRTRSAYDIDADAVVVLDEAGQPLKDDAGKSVRVDAWLPGWLAKRPHFLLDATPPGSGAGGGRKTTTTTINRADLPAIVPADLRAKIASGEVKVVT